jgi:hypothetical protein
MRTCTIIGVVIAGMVMAGCGDRPPPPPPAPVVEVYGDAPPGSIWIRGHYEWYGNDYRWRGGYWARRPYRDAYWHEGHYERRRGGYIYIRGHW